MMDKLRLWAWYFALAVSAVLALITFYTGESILRIVISAIIGFALIYGLCILSISIFEKTGIPVASDSQDIGALLDIAVGQEENMDFDKHPQNPPARAGQLNQEFAEGLPSAEKQAEMVRRMGWSDR